MCFWQKYLRSEVLFSEHTRGPWGQCVLSFPDHLIMVVSSGFSTIKLTFLSFVMNVYLRENALRLSRHLVSPQTFFFLRQSLSVLPRLECSDVVLARCSLHLLASSISPASASWVAGITGAHHHTWLLFVFLVEMGFHHVGWAGLKLLTSSDPPASASQSTGIASGSHCPSPPRFLIASQSQQEHSTRKKIVSR